MPLPWPRLALAVVVGLSTSAVFFVVAGRPPSRAGAAEAPTTAVVVLKEPVGAGRKLEPAQLTKAYRPAGQLPEGAVEDLESAVGRVVKADLVSGEVLLEGRLYPPGRNEDIPQVLPVPPGKRAVTVAVDEVVGVAGFVMPGTFVDVVGTMDVENQAVTRVLLQKVLVLAIAQDSKRKDDPEAKIVSSATLAVTPQESQVLILAADRGKIRLAMRGPTETENVVLTPVTPENLLAVNTVSYQKNKPQRASSPSKVVTRTIFVDRPAKRTAAPKAAPTPSSIMVIRGTQAEMVYREDR